jgi:hypothetical protein
MTQLTPKPSPAARLCALINAPDILVLGVFDGFSTRLVERIATPPRSSPAAA